MSFNFLRKVDEEYNYILDEIDDLEIYWKMIVPIVFIN